MGELITASEWKRAAIVWAFTHDGRSKISNVKSMPVTEFVGLGLSGLASSASVVKYRKAWKLAIERREVVAELTDAGMSGEAMAEVLDVSNATVSRDRGLTNVRPDSVTGQDGKTYPHPAPKPKEPNRNDPVLDDAEYLNILQPTSSPVT
ncbi:helix-turn-helix domain-containing protein [Mycobacteroides abscessus]|uniref:helix-turn-helix domain-containing protein n=1 Tax=Mycobacteroides abscessus TaxID=36809 RepID=UPI000AA5D069|nr:helix-turn-helix domain-containing protein [Mycobacteroides abscessus]